MLLSICLLSCVADPEPSGRDPLDSPLVESAPPPDSDSPDAVDSPTSLPDSDSPIDSPVDSPVDTAPVAWRSALYPVGWTPAFTADDGHFLHDFSYAGYHAGEVALPDPLPGNVFDVTLWGADPTGTTDSTAGIQGAIDAAVDGGVVYLPVGTYRVDGTLQVSSSGVVVQGAGPTSTFVYFTQGEGLDYQAHLTFSGSVSQGVDYPLATDGNNRANTVGITDVSGLSVGDEVALGFTITDDFVADHGMTDIWYSFNGDWKTFYRRTIVAIDASVSPAQVTLDVPLRGDMLVRDGASLRVESGYLAECGLQDLAISNVNTWAVAWAATQVHAVLFSEVRDCWARNVVSWESPLSTDGLGKHLMSSGLEVLDSRRVTVSEVTLENAQHRGDGGNGYLFEISRSNEILTVDSVARAGRHNFIQNWDFGTSGCVWLRATSADGRSLLADWDPVGYVSYSEFHHSLATANLIDQSVASDGWQGVNRNDESSGAGHSVTESVWWNLSGGGYLRSLQYGDGYIVGTTDMDVYVDPDAWDWNGAGVGTAPEDWTEGLEEGALLEPPSLYEDQLARRLGGG